MKAIYKKIISTSICKLLGNPYMAGDIMKPSDACTYL